MVVDVRPAGCGIEQQSPVDPVARTDERDRGRQVWMTVTVACWLPLTPSGFHVIDLVIREVGVEH
jgi:hypothetical protein